jgi:hypothetical protein
MTCGGAGKPSPRGMPGAMIRLSAWWNRRYRPRTQRAQPWPVMAAMGRQPTTCCGALCKDVPSAWSPAPFARGSPQTLRPRAHGPSCSSGIMPLGTSARRCARGAKPISAKPNTRGAVASGSVGYRARVPGSIRLSPSGCLGNGPSWNPLACAR